MVLAGVASVSFGVLVWMYPGAGALALLTFIGVYALIFGLSLVGLASTPADGRLRRVNRQAAGYKDRSAGPTPPRGWRDGRRRADRSCLTPGAGRTVV